MSGRAFAHALLLIVTAVRLTAGETVKTYEGKLTIPTYEHSGRETEPPLFATSTLTGMYPFTTYIMPFTPASPQPHIYDAVFVENEYLKLTYLPELGGRFFSLYDKLRKREVFYRNDVIKPAPYNPRLSWPQSGIELTGPHDLHMMTLHGEPYWSNKIVRRADGGISLVLSEIDPVYQMKVNFTATLHPGLAALELGVFCYNPRDARMPQMFWTNAALPATPKTRFIYPMSRTVGHTTAEIAGWPVYNGIDYSWDRNNKHMLGVFGIDIYDNFQGAYQFENDYGVFRFADRRVVQGMKLWTFGYGEGAKGHEHGYTDNAGPYVEVQSGRHVWDGHYEWVAPHQVEGWSEWWIPVQGTGGLTTLSRDVALNLDVRTLTLSAIRPVPGAQLSVKRGTNEVLRTGVNLDPAKPIRIEIQGNQDLAGSVIAIADPSGRALLSYRIPESDPGRQEYTPFTKPLEEAHKPREQMGAEELTLAAEFKLKELDAAGAGDLLEKALHIDAGYSRAHLLLGIDKFRAGEFTPAVEHLEKAIARDPYSSESYYYLAMSQLALGKTAQAERNLYYIWPDSAYFGHREYQLGRLALLAKDYATAAGHLAKSIAANGNDLMARLTLALCYRELGDRQAAMNELAQIDRIDPANRLAEAERFFLGIDTAKTELVRLMGAQSQEAIGTSVFYSHLERWNEVVRILQLTEETNRDPWGTPPEYFYTLAWSQRHAGQGDRAAHSLEKARAAAGRVDRFPFREEAEPPLAEAVRIDPKDNLARYLLGCLLYFHNRPQEALREWEAAAEIQPNDFSVRRALGLAYAEQGMGVDRATAQLERAIELKPGHVPTLNDLSTIYARAGRFDAQLNLLQKALERSPGDDDLAESLLTAHLSKGNYDAAAHLVGTHSFAPRHRSYSLRDKYRMMRYGMAAQAFHRQDYKSASELFRSARQPPVSLGVDDFQFQASTRLTYYLGRALEAQGKSAEARQEYEKGLAGFEQLTGDRDSWNSENYFMVLAMDRLGRDADAAKLSQHFENFAQTEVDAKSAEHRAEARYLMGLIRKHEGRVQEARQMIVDALEARPDLLPARLELRGDVLDPLPPGEAH